MNKTELDGHRWYVEDGEVVIEGVSCQNGVVTLTGDEVEDMVCALAQEEV